MKLPTGAAGRRRASGVDLHDLPVVEDPRRPPDDVPASSMNTRSWKASAEAGYVSRADTSAVSESGSRTSSSKRTLT
jgi:hypothetical protein